MYANETIVRNVQKELSLWQLASDEAQVAEFLWIIEDWHTIKDVGRLAAISHAFVESTFDLLGDS